MLKGLRVCTHRVDNPAVFIFPADEAWDHERIDSEVADLVAAKLAEVKAAAVEAAAREAGVEVDALSPEQREAAEACVLTLDEEREARLRHPVGRYHAGETRFDLTASDHGPNGPVASVLDYLKPDAVPTTFHLRRLTFRQRAELEAARFAEVTRGGGDPIGRWLKAVRHGVAKIAEGDHVLWALPRPDAALPEEWIEILGDAVGGPAVNLITLAGAVEKYSAPLTDAEGKR